MILFTAVGLVLRALLAMATQHFRSPELRYIQADNYMGSAAYLRQFGHIPDPLNVPGYIEICAFFQRFFPNHTIPALVTLQVLIDTAAIPLTWLLAGRLFGPRVAAMASVLVTFDFLLTVQPGLVLTEALYIPLLLVVINVFVAAYGRTVLDGATLARYGRRGCWRDCAPIRDLLDLQSPLFSVLFCF